MSDTRGNDILDDPEFSWGLKDGRSVKNKYVQFYKSFTYDGVEYFLYDSVYMFKKGELKPYIGKLIQIYELVNKARKVKVLWFFYPSEISNYLGGESCLENEIFLATGIGKGAANVNPLENSRWMIANSVPLEERMKEAHDNGTLVMLQNLDPKYTSFDVENIIWCGFGYKCTAKMVPHTAISSPHSGQAFAIFKTRELANRVVMKLGEECLMLSNGRPLVVSNRDLGFSRKQSSFPGHLVIDKLKHQMSQELREAVSTSHFAQPNNLEYGMALEWCVIQARSDIWWKKLHEEQGGEIENLKASLMQK